MPSPPAPLRSGRPRLAALGLLLATSSVALTLPGPAHAAAVTTVDRVAGDDRYQTAALLSADTFGPGVNVVHLSDGATFPDALAAGAAAAAGDGPVLLTTARALPAVTADELVRLRPARVVVTGGTAAVSDQVLDQVRSLTGAGVTRAGGQDRYDTAAQLSAATFRAGVESVWVATGESASDALSASAAAGAAGGPVLLLRPDGVPAPVEAELRRLAPRRIVIAGGGSAVPEAVRILLTRLAPAVTRVAGPDRYATSAAISTYGFPALTAARVLLASGEQFPDALVAAPVAARQRGPVLLVRPTCVPEDAVHEIAALVPSRATLLGGSAALGPELDRLAPCPPLIADGPLADGVSLTTLRERNGPGGPTAIRVVTVELSRPSSLDTVLAGDALPGLETTTSMARRRGAVVAVNGDYFLSDGRPVHVFAEDGVLAKSANDLGRGVAVSADETRSYVGFLDLRTSITGPGGERLTVERVNNGPATAGQRALHTNLGRALEKPPVLRCTARFRLDGPPALDAEGHVRTPLTTSDPACGDPSPPSAGEAVLTAAPSEPLPTWGFGSAAGWDWNLEGWPGVLDVMGGNPAVVRAGTIVDADVDGIGAYYERNPRTAVSFTADGRALLLVVDGRQPGYSVGMTLRELAEVMVRLGAVEALNLDGGGSTIMVVNGQTVTRPSGAERPVANALLVLPGADPGEAGRSSALSTGMAAAPSTATPPPTTGQAPQTVSGELVWPQVAADPGSAGGLLGLTD
ncbi:MAG: cell wall-binding repeat-containing protein [Mycobacteriales bacterium]